MFTEERSAQARSEILTRKKTRYLPHVFNEISPEEEKKKYVVDPENPWGRMHKPSKVGHLLITKTLEGEENIQQFANTQDLSRFRPLIVEGVSSEHKISAHTPNGTKMQSNRSVELSIDGNPSTLLFLSPERKGSKNPEDYKVHAKVKKRLIFEDEPKLETENQQKSQEELLSSLSPSVKKGEGDKITTPSVLRDRHIEKHKSNRTVMKKSAEQELIDYIEAQKETIEPKKLAILKVLANAFKIEWLHRLAYSLSPTKFNPQVAENMGAGPKWINTLMMTLEKLAKHFTVQHPGMVSVEPEFEMLSDSEVIDKINYKVTIQQGEKSIVVSQNISVLALPDRSNWPSTTDSKQLIHVIENLMDEKQVGSKLRA